MLVGEMLCTCTRLLSCIGICPAKDSCLSDNPSPHLGASDDVPLRGEADCQVSTLCSGTIRATTAITLEHRCLVNVWISVHRLDRHHPLTAS